MTTDKQIEIPHIESEIALDRFDDPLWSTAEPVSVSCYWSGEIAPKGRHAEARLLWSDDALFARFDAVQMEPLVVSDDADISKKTIGLWDRDVCEVFIAPDAGDNDRYFEFEAAPTGEWVDLELRLTADGRKSDIDYDSGMSTAAKIGEGKFIILMRIPWRGLGRRPRPGDVWRGNLYRCVGRDPGRGYLAWQPTMTDVPSFHVPERFGKFRFVDKESRRRDDAQPF